MAPGTKNYEVNREIEVKLEVMSCAASSALELSPASTLYVELHLESRMIRDRVILDQ